MKSFTPLLVLLLLLALFSATPAHSAADATEPPLLGLSLGLGLEFETGDYGGTETIDTWRVPFLVQYAPGARLAFSLEIPWVSQSGSSDAVVVGGTPRGFRATTLANGSGSGSGGGSTSSDRNAGLGDIKLNASVTLLPEGESAPRLLALLYAKFPTADEEKGLGTGAFDYGGGLGIGRKFGDWGGYAECLYIQAGSSDLYDPDPYLEWLASLSYRATPSLRPALALAGGTASFPENEDPLEIRLQLAGLGGEQTSYSLSLTRGLSDGSPEWGVSLSGFLDF